MVETGEFEHDYIWDIDGDSLRIGGSPSSKDGVVSTEYLKMAEWRGPHESGEFHSAKARLQVMDAEDTWLSVNYPTLFLQWPVAKDPALNQALTRAYNNWIADISSQAPDRLKWVTVIDLHDVKEAVREMERTKDMGSVGVMVLGAHGINVVTIAPGSTTSDREEALAAEDAFAEPAASIQRRGVPSDLTGVMAFLFSDDAHFISGQMIVVNGGREVY